MLINFPVPHTQTIWSHLMRWSRSNLLQGLSSELYCYQGERFYSLSFQTGHFKYFLSISKSTQTKALKYYKITDNSSKMWIRKHWFIEAQDILMPPFPQRSWLKGHNDLHQNVRGKDYRAFPAAVPLQGSYWTVLRRMTHKHYVN